MASTGKTRDIQCRKCLGFGHIERECRTKRVMLVREDGEYDSASDFDEDTLALIAARDGTNSDSEREMEGIEVDPAKIEAIENWPQPKTVTQVGIKTLVVIDRASKIGNSRRLS
ncbi:hypothetical protein QYE76_052530 [Lolium multiflorum]|uniref:CCHC-type domain-containing protein n=1 Tax=Lolium multiflorum TaxID=4521 RepID=A0AAD8SVJ4_LOLMU|nr:hypothetical protein QYE76_052530 [Lolium multiflorum]